MQQNKFGSALSNIYRFTKNLGEDFGKLTTLVALPGACIAAVAFYSEIRDTLTAPDVSGDIVSMELRCGVEIGSEDEAEEARRNFGKVCGDAPFSVSFEVNISNEDVLERIISDAYARVSFPALQNGELELRLTRVIKHSVINYVTRTSANPWQAIRLAPREVRRIEFQFRPLQRAYQVPFKAFRSLVRRSPSLLLENDEISAEFWGVISGKFGNERRIAQCNAVFEKDAIERVNDKPDDGFVAFVLICSEDTSDH